MANYNVGNIEIGAVTNSKSALSDLDSIINKLNQIKNSNSKVVDSSNKINTSYKTTQNSIDSLSKSINSTFNLGKIYFLFNYLKRLGQGIVTLIGYASDYTETLNKFQVSFAELYEENLAYVEKLSSAYGFSRNTLMDYQSTFNNMLKSLQGLTNESSALISQTLTRMAIDYSSLFNVSIERSMRAFQSVLSGSIRPIREASGFDVSETSIYQVYKELGGEKSMRQLNQLEKRLLRIIAIQRQMEKVGAFGDYERTIETVSNQLRVFQEQLKEFGTIWGQLVIVRFKPVLQYLNGIIIAFNELGKLITKNIDLTSDITMDEEFAGLTTNVIEADEAVEELNKSLSLLGLDQLNILGSSSTTSNIGVSQEILDAIGEYTSALDNVNFKAKEISKNILKWLGYTYNANGELEKTGNTLDKIINIITTIISIFVASAIISKLSSLYSIIQSISVVIGTIGGTASGVLAIIALIGVALVDLFTDGSQQSQAWINTLTDQWNNVFLPAIQRLEPIFNQLFDTLGYIYEDIIKPIASIVGDIIVYVLVPTLGTILDLITTIAGFLMPIIQFLVGTSAPILEVIILAIKNILKVFEAIYYVAIQIVDGLLFGVKQFINFFIDGLNWIISQLNKLQWKAPDWLGGWTIGFDFKEIPKFAKGNVATEPTLAMFGEYSNAKSDPEITSPQSIMQETFMQSITPLINAILKGDKEVINAIKQQNMTLNINGKKLAESTLNDFEDVAIRKGKILFNK